MMELLLGLGALVAIGFALAAALVFIEVMAKK
jgi:hypothetical protein